MSGDPRWEALTPRNAGTAVVTLSGRSRRLWLAPAEKVLTAHGEPNALAWRHGRTGLVAGVLHGDDNKRRAHLQPQARIVAVHGAPNGRYVHLSPIAELLGHYDISRHARLSWDSEHLWLGPVSAPVADRGACGELALRQLRADGRLGIGPLRSKGPLPRRLRLDLQTRLARVELRVAVGLDPSDPSVFCVRGPKTSPYVVLGGPRGREAKRVLGAVSGRGTRVWVRAEVGRLVVVPLVERLAPWRPL